MNWSCSLALAVVLDPLLRDGESLQQLNSSRTASSRSWRDRKTGRSRIPSQSSMMSSRSISDSSEAVWIYLQRDFPVRDGVTPGSDWEPSIRETSGPPLFEQLEMFDPPRYTSKMSQASDPTSARSPEIYGLSGMMLGGVLYPLETLEPDISAAAGGAWPTPTVSHVTRGNHDEPIEDYLARVEDYNAGRAKGKPGKSLGIAVRWPTPTCGDSKSSGSIGYEKTSTHSPGKTLCDATERGFGPTVKRDHEWPTPTASDRHGGGKGAIRKDTGKLNPAWCEWLMGWPCGWSSLDPLPVDVLDSWLEMVNAGTYWDVDPADTGEVPRLTEKNEHRRARLMAIGNGQVPAQARLAFRLLS